RTFVRTPAISPPHFSPLQTASRSDLCCPQCPAVLLNRWSAEGGKVICIQEDSEGGDRAKTQPGVELKIRLQQLGAKRDPAGWAPPTGEHGGIKPVFENLCAVCAEPVEQSRQPFDMLAV